MAGLHEALTYLSPTSWEDVPRDDLGPYLTQCFQAGELLCNSVPPPPHGTVFEYAEPQFKMPNSAKSSKELHPSPARPAPPDKDHQDLRQNWGKPMKFSQKENPLEVGLFKMAGRDRHGAWYSRHNVIEGIGFSKLKRALQREFPETLLTTGEPGAGAKRGLSADRRIERMDVDGVGRLEVYELSAQMPPPVTPREFVTLFMTSDQALTEKSTSYLSGGSKNVPRHHMVVSRPILHPETPERDKFVRGKYESVEMIREIPLHNAGSTSNLSSKSGAACPNDPELNPVEWIMVTRSDPAGGVPRFLVDRGTPGAMLGDVTKFLDWACSYDDVPDEDADLEKQQATSAEKAKEVAEDDGPPQSSLTNGEKTAAGCTKSGKTASVPSTETVAREAAAPVAVAQEQAQTGVQGGFMSSVTSAVKAGVDTYAPTAVSSFVYGQSSIEQEAADDESDSSDSSSGSFMSADEVKRYSTAPEGLAPGSTDDLSIASAASSGDKSKPDKKDLSKHDREALRIMSQREKLDAKLAKKRAEAENKLKQSNEKDQTEQEKARQKMDAEMKKTEERHRKEIEKLESKRDRESRKAEERKKKKEEQNKLTLVARERDELRSQASLLRKENSLLSVQVEALQRENTALTTRLGKIGGAEAVKAAQDDANNAEGTKSGKSGSSGASGIVTEKSGIDRSSIA